MPRQIVNRWKFLTAYTLSNCTLVIFQKIFQSPIANFSRYFLNHVVLCLCHVDYDSMFRVLTAKRLIAVISIFLLNLVFFIDGLFQGVDCISLWIVLLFFVVWLYFSRTLTFFIVIVIASWLAINFRKWSFLVPTITLVLTQTGYEIYFIIDVTIRLNNWRFHRHWSFR